MRTWLLAVPVLAAAGAHRAHRSADAARFEDGDHPPRTFLPAPEALRVATLGYHTATADLLWVRTVLAFVDVLDERERGDARGAEWLAVMIETINTLDPSWRTAYFYGGTMLRVVDDLDGSDAVFERAEKALPNDPFFPFSLAMNAYLYRHDVEAAVGYLERAAALPGAPSWYRAAVAGFLHREGRRDAALRYLEEQIEAASDESVREALLAKRRRVVHDDLAEQLEEARARFRESVERDIGAPEELGALPPDPMGGTWIVSPDGPIRSSVIDAEMARWAVSRERNMLLGKHPPR